MGAPTEPKHDPWVPSNPLQHRLSRRHGCSFGTSELSEKGIEAARFREEMKNCNLSGFVGWEGSLSLFVSVWLVEVIKKVEFFG